MRRVTALSASVLLVTAPAWAQNPVCPSSAEIVTEFGKSWEPRKTVTSNQRVKLNPPDQSAFRHVMVRLLAASEPGVDWTITIRDSRERAVEILSAQDFKTQPATGLWTKRLTVENGESATFFFELFVPDPSQSVSVRLMEGVAMPASSKFPRYSCQNPDKPSYSFLYAAPETFGVTKEAASKMRRLADRVGMLVNRGTAFNGTRVSWCCSGVMLTNDLFLTNWHCGAAETTNSTAVWNDMTCNDVVVDMSWDNDRNGRELGCHEVVAVNEALDYALLRVEPLAGSLRQVLGEPIVFSDVKVKRNDAITLIHHPECKPKQVSTSCQVDEPERKSWRDRPQAYGQSEFTHVCDTEGGSSGAPVFDDASRLVGIHHLGFEPLAANGRCDKRNKAIAIQSILADIKERNPTAYDAIQKGR